MRPVSKKNLTPAAKQILKAVLPLMVTCHYFTGLQPAVGTDDYTTWRHASFRMLALSARLAKAADISQPEAMDLIVAAREKEEAEVAAIPVYADVVAA